MHTSPPKGLRRQECLFPAYSANAVGLGEMTEKDACGKDSGIWQSLKGEVLNRFTAEPLRQSVLRWQCKKSKIPASSMQD